MAAWRINLHYPWWMRAPPPRPEPRLATLRTLEAALLARGDVSLSGSAAACRPRAFPDEVVSTLNFHTVWTGPRNLHFKEAYLPGYFTFDPAGHSGWSANAGLRFDPSIRRPSSSNRCRFASSARCSAAKRSRSLLRACHAEKLLRSLPIMDRV